MKKWWRNCKGSVDLSSGKNVLVFGWLSEAIGVKIGIQIDSSHIVLVSLALAHADIDDGKVVFVPWVETDFRTGEPPWWS
ncbi:hypothetical protein QVD17_14135 [Tagetes erecta]|uniref:Uncharacterized protein n=1 Tax=Tagetes erecta TaxID=13708 RepID=A0AAD8L488_TARER|nr:hypothetical protein QVD17_14135 [Tagetes erecta]